MHTRREGVMGQPGGKSRLLAPLRRSRSRYLSIRTVANAPDGPLHARFDVAGAASAAIPKTSATAATSRRWSCCIRGDDGRPTRMPLLACTRRGAATTQRIRPAVHQTGADVDVAIPVMWRRSIYFTRPECLISAHQRGSWRRTGWSAWTEAVRTGSTRPGVI